MARSSSSSSSRASQKQRQRSIQTSKQWTTYKPNKTYLRELNQAERNQPIYQDAYKGLKDLAVANLENAKFEFDAANNNAYQAYARDYELLGDVAAGLSAENIEGLSGGYGTTYSGSVAQQGLDNHLSNEKAILPSLYQQERQNYQSDVAGIVNKGNLYNALEQQDYAQFQDKLAKWNANREYSYNKYWNAYLASAKTHNKSKGTESSSESSKEFTHQTSTTVTPSSGGRRRSTPKSIPKSALKSKEAAKAWLEKNGYGKLAGNIMSKTGDMDDNGFAAEVANKRMGSYVGYTDDTEEGKKEKKRLDEDYSDYLLTYIRQAMGLEDENWFEKEQKRQNKARRKYYGY